MNGDGRCLLRKQRSIFRGEARHTRSAPKMKGQGLTSLEERDMHSFERSHPYLDSQNMF